MSPDNLDIVNGLFEFIGAYFTWHNAYRLYIDKQVKGVFWGTWLYFSLWGGWNLFYYTGLNQPLSFLGGLVLLLGNIAWITLAFIYRGDKE